MLDTDNGKSITWLKFFGCFLLCSQRRFFFAVFGQTRILLGNTDTPIERSHKKKSFKKSKTIDALHSALIQKIQLDEHGKFRYYVIFATMDMPMFMCMVKNRCERVDLFLNWWIITVFLFND
jgi:hypothetical protein